MTRRACLVLLSLHAIAAVSAIPPKPPLLPARMHTFTYAVVDLGNSSKNEGLVEQFWDFQDGAFAETAVFSLLDQTQQGLGPEKWMRWSRTAWNASGLWFGGVTGATNDPCALLPGAKEPWGVRDLVEHGQWVGEMYINGVRCNGWRVQKGNTPTLDMPMTLWIPLDGVDTKTNTATKIQGYQWVVGGATANSIFYKSHVVDTPFPKSIMYDPTC